MSNDPNNPDVKNYYYVNGPQNNYNINMSGNSTLKIFGKDAADFEDNISNTPTPDDQSSCPTPPKNTLKRQKYAGILSSDKAEPYWQKLRKAKLVDKHNQPLNLSWSETGYIAYNFAAVLGIEERWKEFGSYWNLDKESLRSNYNRGLEYASLSNIIEKTKDIFN